MNAIVCPRPGRPDVLELQDIEKPTVADDGVLVRVRASSVNPVDFFPLSPVGFRIQRLRNRGKGRAVVLGTDFAGVVESVGKTVSRFKPGDEVFGGAKGAFAEYVSVSEQGQLTRKPANVTFEQAAAVPVAGLTALQAVRDHGRVQPGQKVLVNGASGGVGTFTVKLAKYFGAEVTAVCGPGNAATVASIGADRVIDYTAEDFTRNGHRYDVLLDVAGSHSWSECTRVLAPGATFVAVGASTNTVWGGGRTLRHLAAVRLASWRSNHRAAFFIAKLNEDDLRLLAELLEGGHLTPMIDRCYPLSHAAQAMNYMGEGHAKGKIVIVHA
jgi:NADPH:quinone reductase-like Zn-dependent oxidoreductase